MTVADAALVQEAVTALGLTDLGPIGAVGGQKAVHLVRDASGAEQVLKVVAVDFATPDALTRAKREVELLGLISNPNVVRVESALIELGTPTHGAAWVEEHLDGQDLGALVGPGHPQWSWAAAREMGIQVANGLADAHDRVVTHRDLSANNVRQLSDGTYRVLDFGVARHTLLTGITTMGQPGTRGFMTPEHLNSFSGGPMRQSDVFQVGNLMYLALTGVLPIPYPGNDADYMMLLSNLTMVPLATLRPDLSPAQIAVVATAMHSQPARRYLNGAALRDALIGTT
jgi:serine/threonine-protein kinase